MPDILFRVASHSILDPSPLCTTCWGLTLGCQGDLFLSWLDRWFISFLALWTLKQIHFWLSNFDSVWFSIQSYIMLHLWPKVSDRTRLAAWESILRSHCVAAWRKAAEGLGIGGIGKGTTSIPRTGASKDLWRCVWKWSKTGIPPNYYILWSFYGIETGHFPWIFQRIEE